MPRKSKSSKPQNKRYLTRMNGAIRTLAVENIFKSLAKSRIEKAREEGYELVSKINHTLYKSFYELYENENYRPFLKYSEDSPVRFSIKGRRDKNGLTINVPKIHKRYGKVDLTIEPVTAITPDFDQESLGVIDNAELITQIDNYNTRSKSLSEELGVMLALLKKTVEHISYVHELYELVPFARDVVGISETRDLTPKEVLQGQYEMLNQHIVNDTNQIKEEFLTKYQIKKQLEAQKQLIKH